MHRVICPKACTGTNVRKKTVGDERMTTALATRDLSAGFGAEVIGVAPRIPLADDQVEQLRRLFDDKGMIVLRGVDVDLRFQTYLLYHSDLMWSEDVFRLLSLYGVEVEQPTSPTMFVSAARAWETLPEDLRRRVEGRYAIHCQDATHRQRGDGDVLVSTFAEVESIRLPIGHRHPRTGRMLLYVAQQMTDRIDGMDEAESEALLQDLFDHMYRPENTVEHHWREGLVLWDNIALQHARSNVRVEGPVRTLRKVLAPTPKPTWNAVRQFSKVGE
jgi:alpha-ketoglutarate-dependent taurine dioxygenase